MNLEKSFFHVLNQTKEIQKNKKILIAFSGGVDSVALTLLMKSVACTYQLEIALVYVNHQLRQEARGEETFVRMFAKSHGLPLSCVSWVDGKTTTSGIEKKARDFRYQVFKEKMREGAFDYLLTAHHGDDLTETMLMKWIRGSRILNFSNVMGKRAFATGSIVRPLLPFSKKEIRAYVVEKNEQCIEDESNNRSDYFRNRVRKEVLPFIQKEQPKYIEQMMGYSQEFAYIKEILKEKATIFLKENLEETRQGFVLQNMKEKTRAERFVILDEFFQEYLILQIHIKKTQMEEILDVLEKEQSPLTVILEKGITITKKGKQLQINF